MAIRDGRLCDRGITTLAMVIGSWTSMRRAEKRRDKVREK
jgi:hypothetical protein